MKISINFTSDDFIVNFTKEEFKTFKDMLNTGHVQWIEFKGLLINISNIPYIKILDEEN